MTITIAKFYTRSWLTDKTGCGGCFVSCRVFLNFQSSIETVRSLSVKNAVISTMPIRKHREQLSNVRVLSSREISQRHYRGTLGKLRLSETNLPNWANRFGARTSNVRISGLKVRRIPASLERGVSRIRSECGEYCGDYQSAQRNRSRSCPRICVAISG